MTPQMLPLGIINLGTILNQNGVDVKLIDFLAERDAGNTYEYALLPKVLTSSKFLQKFKKYDPDIVGITSYTENYPIALRIARMCKNEKDEVRLMLGGPHVTFQAEECLKNNPLIDLVAIGEIDHLILDIVKGLSGQLEITEIPNIAYSKNNSIRFNPVKGNLTLDAIPSPNFELIKDKLYPPFFLHLEFSRGCPYSCAFCSLSPISGNKIRFFPIKRVIENLLAFEEQFKKYNFFITDPNFLVNPKRVRLFLEEVKSQKIELPAWDFQTRVDLINREILNDLKKANADQITLGIEDVNDSVLQACGKNQTFSQVERSIKIIKELDFRSHSNFIIGLPSQTREHMLKNISYSSKLDRFNFSTLKPFPGSKIYDNPENYGLTILSKEWERYITYEIVLDSTVFPRDQQKEVLKQAVQHYAEEYAVKGDLGLLETFETQTLLNLGFEEWYERWKKDRDSGWN